jgi:hypothetical protein
MLETFQGRKELAVALRREYYANYQGGSSSGTSSSEG